MGFSGIKVPKMCFNYTRSRKTSIPNKYRGKVYSIDYIKMREAVCFGSRFKRKQSKKNWMKVRSYDRDIKSDY